MSSWSPRARVAIAPRRAGPPHTQDSAIVPVTTTSRERPRTATVAVASSVSSPRNSRPPTARARRARSHAGRSPQGLEELPNRHVEGLFVHAASSYARRDAQPRAAQPQRPHPPNDAPSHLTGRARRRRKAPSAAFVEKERFRMGACWSSIASVSQASRDCLFHAEAMLAAHRVVHAEPGRGSVRIRGDLFPACRRGGEASVRGLVPRTLCPGEQSGCSRTSGEA